MINYEGISYNLETIIEFKSLKLLLEALAKKQIEHNIFFCGQNNININKENIEDKTENKDQNNNDENFEKIWMDKINNSGLIKEFIESQKKLLEQDKLINELKDRIESLEKNKSKIRDDRLTKRITNKEKNKDQDNSELKEKTEKKIIVINKEDNKGLNKEINKNDNKSNENINININNNPIKEEKIINEPVNAESKTINIYDTKSKTKTEASYINSNNDEKYANLENKYLDLDEKINLLNEKLEEIEQITDNNTNDIDNNKERFSQIDEAIKNLEKNMGRIPISENKKSEEKIKEEEKNLNINSNERENLENELNLFESKIMKIIDQNIKEMKKAKSDSNVMKELNAEKEKLKDATDRINIEINKLKKKDEEIEDKLTNLTPLTEIKKTNEKIKILEQDMEEYATKNDIRHVLGEIEKYEKEMSKFKSFIISQKEMNNKNRDDINKLKAALNSLKQNFSALNNLFESNSLTKLIEDINNMSDMYVEKSEYEKNIKDLYKKINDMQMDVNEHNRNFGEIMPKIKKIVDIEELNKLQRKIDELMSRNGNESNNNKSLDSEEIIKNIKAIESQVKIFMKKLETENEKEKLQNDNCILASRPVGGFKCASCETYIGDIKESNVFLPWNKYHGYDRPYRLGSSFSRILQGLNIEQNYNPFLQRKTLLKSENEKRNHVQNESLSVKKVKKIPPLNQLTFSQENNNEKINKISNKTLEENNKINESSALGIIHSTKRKKKLNLNLWGIKSLKNLGNEKNILTLNVVSKKKKKNSGSFDKDKKNNSITEEKIVKISKKPKGNTNNMSSDENENHLVIPSL